MPPHEQVEASEDPGLPLPPGTVLAPGLWMILSPLREQEPAMLRAQRLEELGLTGVIVHDDRLRAVRWCTPERVASLQAMGLKTAVGLSLLNPPYLPHVTRGLIAAVDACTREQHPTVGVRFVEDHGSWDGHVYEAAALVEDVLKQAPRAPEFCVDAPIWDPITTLQARPSRPHAPYGQWARLATHEIYVRACGAPREELTKHLLSWARHNQWPRMDESYRARVFATVQTYHRSLRDHLSLLLSESHLCLWNDTKMDEIGRYALRVRVALTRIGPLGPDAIVRFQEHRGLRPHGQIDAPTAAALGLPPPPVQAPVLA